MASVWDRFERKIVLCYTGYKERYESIRRELKRVGMEDVVFKWDAPTPLKEILKQHIPTTDFTKRIGPFSCCLSHYLAAKESYELGYNNVLVMEDDIRFLEDTSLIRSIVKSIPEDFDYAQFERAKPYKTPIDEWLRMKNGMHLNEFWIPFTDLRGGGCYAMSRKGMAFLIREMEKVFVEKHEKLQSNDFYIKRGDGLNRIFCYPSLAVQAWITESNSDILEYWRRNELDGLSYSQYHMEGTYMPIYDDSDFISKLEFALDRPVQKNIPKTIKRVYNRWDIKPLLNYLFPDAEQVTEGAADVAIVWGYNTSTLNRSALSAALKYDIPILLCEPGFVSSGTTWANKSANSKYRVEHSVMIDLHGQFFDGMRRTDLEGMLNDTALTISEEQRLEARRLIDRIVSNKISKYNHQPIYTPNIGRNGVRKVLVVDQSYGDFSIKRGLADDATFDRMLQAAIEENPDADILVKTHPDTIAGKTAMKMGYYQDLKEHNNIYKVAFPINPYSLMEICDKVYVCSSQFGLEALMAGKEVHVFGMPFYAGWGLTIDEQHLARRTNTRTLEELFYIFYCMYTRWIDPDKGCATTMDAIIDKMIALREELRTTPSSHSSSGNGYCIGRPKVYCSKIESEGNTNKKGWNW